MVSFAASTLALPRIHLSGAVCIPGGAYAPQKRHVQVFSAMVQQSPASDASFRCSNQLQPSASSLQRTNQHRAEASHLALPGLLTQSTCTGDKILHSLHHQTSLLDHQEQKELCPQGVHMRSLQFQLLQQISTAASHLRIQESHLQQLPVEWEVLLALFLGFKGETF